MRREDFINQSADSNRDFTSAARPNDPLISGLGLYDSQMAGLATLIPNADSTAALYRTGELKPVSVLDESGELKKQGSLTILIRRLRQDHMMRSSLYLMSNSGLQAGFGFMFWIISAHLFSAADVGKASALISATTVIGYLALLGLNNGIGRYMPTAHDRNSLTTSALALVGISACVIAICYAYLTPALAPELAFITRNPALTVGFALLTASAAVNILTDSIFVATRKAGYTVFVDGIVAGISKLSFAVALTGAGAYGLFLASALGTAMAALASLGLIYTIMRTRISLQRAVATLKRLLRFSSANYIGNILNMLPTLVVPVIALDRLGAPKAAYYFIVYQVVSILYAAALAIDQTFLAEGSHENANISALARRSLRILVVLCLPATVVLILISRWLLVAFGGQYYTNGFPSFLLLAIATGPITAVYWCVTILRLTGRLRSIIIVNATYATCICGIAWFAASHGLTALAIAWPVGSLIAAIVAGASIPRDLYAGILCSRARHRRRSGARRFADKKNRVPKNAVARSHRKPRTHWVQT
jgi:O-antigen/teichoic acid export membrane protein